ncbi:MAG: gas vesicle protein [Acidobacteriota bacterium]
MPSDLPVHSRSTGLVDVLDRVLDKGLVIAGDIKVSLAEVELLTIRIRLLVCSLDKAQEIGLDWWRYDRALSPGASAGATRALQDQIIALERKVEALIAATDRASRIGSEEAAQAAPRRARRRK